MNLAWIAGPRITGLRGARRWPTAGPPTEQGIPHPVHPRAAGRDYQLTVAIGKFDPSQPYSPSTHGGYTIELLASRSSRSRAFSTLGDTPSIASFLYSSLHAFGHPLELGGDVLRATLGIRHLSLFLVAETRMPRFCETWGWTHGSTMVDNAAINLSS